MKMKNKKENRRSNDKGERRELNPRMVDSQSTALIHLATSALTRLFLNKNKKKFKSQIHFRFLFFIISY
jgi:hypothetical protein